MKDQPLILLIDDDADIRLVCRDILEGHGMRVAELADADELTDFLEAGFMPAVIILDVMMRRSTAWSALAELNSHEAFSKIPVIVFSAHVDADFREAAARRGVTRCITKPAGRHEIINAVYEAIGAPRS